MRGIPVHGSRITGCESRIESSIARDPCSHRGKMSFLSIDECLGCAWNQSGALRVVRVKKVGNRLELLDYAASTADEYDTIARSLSTLTQRVLTSSTHLVVAGGEFNSSVCFDLLMPPMPISDIRQALSYELPRYLPVDYSQMVIGYRLVPSDSDKLHIRVFAIDSQAWNELLTDFSNFGVRIDHLVSPYMALDPLLADVNEVSFSFFDVNEMFVKGDDSFLRKVIVLPPKDPQVDEESEFSTESVAGIVGNLGYDSDHLLELLGPEEIESYIPALLLAEFALIPEFQENKNYYLPLPRQLKPERFRKLRLLSILLTVFVFLLGGSIIFVNLWEKWSNTHALLNEERAVLDKSAALKHEIAAMEPMENDLISKVASADVGIGNMSQVIHNLCLATPKRVWLLYFSSRERKVDLSARAPAGSQSSLMSALNRSGVFKTKSSNTRRNSDGTENIYIHMLMNPETKSKGGK